ncbi:MAG: hypothetical protein E6I16_15530 [Chloroflexi bacterium]|nr:MAG: hypothetical protein E6I16_15530 [Chloroflexota bacterium]
MGRSPNTGSQRADQVANLTAQVEALKARLEKLETPALRNGNGTGHDRRPQSRRNLLKLAGAAAAGAAGSIVLGAIPAAANDGDSITLGSETNAGQTPTAVIPASGTAPSPLFEAVGQLVTPPTTVGPTVSTTPPLAQSIPLIGAIGPGGKLPPIGNPPVNDFPGYAPIQGVGGEATIATSTGPVFVSEGVNGFGFTAVGIGVAGDSDVGYGVVGSSGGIDLATGGAGRILQTSLLDDLLTSPPSGPPSYGPNDFEQVRDGNGLLYVSLTGGTWVPVQFGGLNQYRLTGSNGTTWMDMDATNLKLTITPTFDCVALLTANADMWTSAAGLNQDLGISFNGAIAGWKESGGFAGTFSPNALFLQTMVQMTHGTTYTIKIQWKTNKAAGASQSIWAGAGPINGAFSPTRLTAQLFVNP